MRWALTLALVVFAVARPVLVRAGPVPDVFPFVTGTTWTYAGTVRWTDHVNRISGRAVRRSSVVTAAFDHGDVAADLLRGGVWDLFEPEAPPREYVLVRVKARYYVVYDNANQTFAALKRTGGKALAGRRYESWFDAPLTPARDFRPEDFPEREDGLHQWFIAKKPRGYVLTYPHPASVTTATIVPGVGITAYTYVHNGTVLEIHVHLVAYHRPAQRPRLGSIARPVPAALDRAAPSRQQRGAPAVVDRGQEPRIFAPLARDRIDVAPKPGL
jgi:hypothetical protein